MCFLCFKGRGRIEKTEIIEMAIRYMKHVELERRQQSKRGKVESTLDGTISYQQAPGLSIPPKFPFRNPIDLFDFRDSFQQLGSLAIVRDIVSRRCQSPEIRRVAESFNKFTPRIRYTF